MTNHQLTGDRALEGKGEFRDSYRMSEGKLKTAVLEKGSSAYSDLVVLPDGRICCLFEDDGYQRIVFTRFSLQWLTEKRK